jgi:hypothetical protein
MFFSLTAIEDHPCCKMQEVVEHFFTSAGDVQGGSVLGSG